MKFFKRKPRMRARVSFILLDWSVRESPHIIHYLRDQTVDPDEIEVIYLEFYDRAFEGLRAYDDRVDIWAALEMPRDVYYNKHLMYNAGIVLASGDIVVVCDLDALVRPGFVERIIRGFDRDSNIVLHLDQFRSMRRDFYPFNFPSVDQVMGEGCINNAGGITTGLRDVEDALHTRNYGACFCAKREDVIAIGGADMHLDYLGHVCGPYDMTFRLRNLGRRIVWADDEFLYHTWHPGTDGDANYLGPHDGRNLSTTSMEFLATGEVQPLAENPAIRVLRTHAGDETAALEQLIEPVYLDHWRTDTLRDRAPILRLECYRTWLGVSDGRLIEHDRGTVRAHSLVSERSVPSLGESRSGARVHGRMICGIARTFDVAAQLCAAYVPQRARRFHAPAWVQRWLLAPAIAVVFPVILLIVGDGRRRIRVLTGEFRDLCNPIRNLVCVVTEATRVAAMRPATVVHRSRVVLATVCLLGLLGLVPRCGLRRVGSGEELAGL
ncbi:MAG TPA: hypothetical protein VGN65_10040, partial [Casimicrobiaceae bacterium]